MEIQNYFEDHIIRYCDVCKQVFKNPIEKRNHVDYCSCSKRETCCNCITSYNEGMYLQSDEYKFLKKLYFNFDSKYNL